MRRYHFICDFYDSTLPADIEEQKAHILKWLDSILNCTAMKIIDGPYFKYGEDSPEGSCGWTMITTIDFSSITLHSFEKTRQICIDIFSCKQFNPKLAEQVCCEFFGENIKFKTFIEV